MLARTTKGPGPEIHRAGGAFVHLPREPSASAYRPRERLRPTRAPCSVHEERTRDGHGGSRGEGCEKARSLRRGPGENVWIVRRAGTVVSLLDITTTLVHSLRTRQIYVFRVSTWRQVA